jgi:polar amino acid transport system substrate-binding protein
MPFGANAADTVPARAPAINSISICEDQNEWPPYSYFRRVNGKKTTALTGYAVDVIDKIFTRRGISYKIDMIPWSRCLAVTSLGEQYAMVLNLSYNPERVKSFMLSRAYYATTAFYYYSRRSHPNGLDISSLADIKKYRVCGVQGYNYESYGLTRGEVDQGATNFPSLISKMQMGRCALFLEKDEIMLAYAAIGKNYLADPDIGKAPLPGVKPDSFYFGISRRYPQAEQLRSLIDDELRQMETSGELDALLRKAVETARHAGTPSDANLKSVEIRRALFKEG